MSYTSAMQHVYDLLEPEDAITIPRLVERYPNLYEKIHGTVWFVVEKHTGDEALVFRRGLQRLSDPDYVMKTGEEWEVFGELLWVTMAKNDGEYVSVHEIQDDDVVVTGDTYVTIEYSNQLLNISLAEYQENWRELKNCVIDVYRRVVRSENV